MANISYRDYVLNLQAGVEQSVSVDGDYWQIIDAVGSLNLRFDEQAVALVRTAAMGGPAAYRRVMVKSPIDQTVRLSLGFTNGAAPYDSRSIQIATIATKERPADSMAGLDDLVITTGNTLQFPANASRQAIIISLDDNAPDYVLVGSATLNKGVRLYPGGQVAVPCIGAINVRNPNAVTVTVSASETVYA